MTSYDQQYCQAAKVMNISKECGGWLWHSRFDLQETKRAKLRGCLRGRIVGKKPPQAYSVNTTDTSPWRATSKVYSSNLTQGQFELIEPLLPPAKSGGRPREVEMWSVHNAITSSLSFSHSTGLVQYLNTCESRQATDLRLNQIFDLGDWSTFQQKLEKLSR